ncbi:hypothetical protein K7I13_02510 [Brucepastera parasyntrophica]|uniref:hypothetical protein n=1 Tax=Brucepastera parasyntrophica TaxID=2880008 RepID=UPI00210BDA6B|nr:hypothetical protein [Brucepastera parasyntrophica]ULQ60208.1 hypothetical protein K7I13_02510 [Brucepastera parasyntrophica]
MISREDVIKFIDNNLRILVISFALLLIILVAVLGFSIHTQNAEKQKADKLAAELKARIIPPKEFWLPVEPLETRGVILSREPHTSWTDDEAEKWYIVPSAESMAELRSAGQTQIEKILESVP